MSLKINEFNPVQLEVRDTSSSIPFLKKDIILNVILKMILDQENFDLICRTAATCKSFYNFFIKNCTVYRARSLLARIRSSDPFIDEKNLKKCELPDTSYWLMPQYIKHLQNGSQLYIDHTGNLSAPVQDKKIVRLCVFDEDKGFSINSMKIPSYFDLMEDGRFLGRDDKFNLCIFKRNDQKQFELDEVILKDQRFSIYNSVYHKGIYFIKCIAFGCEDQLLLCYSEKMGRTICQAVNPIKFYTTSLLSTKDGVFLTYKKNDATCFQKLVVSENDPNVYALEWKDEISVEGNHDWRVVYENLVLGRSSDPGQGYCLIDLGASQQTVKILQTIELLLAASISINQGFLIISNAETFYVFHLPSKTDYTTKFNDLLKDKGGGHQVFSLGFSKTSKDGIILKVLYRSYGAIKTTEVTIFLEKEWSDFLDCLNDDKEEVIESLPTKVDANLIEVNHKKVEPSKDDKEKIIESHPTEVATYPIHHKKIEPSKVKKLTSPSPNVYIISTFALGLLTLAVFLVLRYTFPGSVLFKISKLSIGTHECMALAAGSFFSLLPLAIWSCKRLKAR